VILLEYRPDRGTDRLAQTILNRIAAYFLVQSRKYRRVGMMGHGVICLQVGAAGRGGSSHPKMIHLEIATTLKT
jgi:hypothetical protein